MRKTDRQGPFRIGFVAGITWTFGSFSCPSPLARHEFLSVVFQACVPAAAYVPVGCVLVYTRRKEGLGTGRTAIWPFMHLRALLRHG